MIGTSTQGSSAHESLARAVHDARTGVIRSFYGMAARLDRVGCVIVGLGILIALHPLFPQVAAVGSFLVILMACSTLSFLVTTPEAWVSGAGNSVHGFPFLALPGLLVVKDSIMLGAAILTMADSAKTYLKRIVLRPSF